MFIMTIVPGMALFKDADMATIYSRHWLVVMDHLVNKWVDECLQKGNRNS